MLDPLTATSPGAEFHPIKSADRALEVLEELARSGAASLGELSTRLGIPKSSLHGILRTMENRRWTECDASRSVYQLGIRALLVGASYVDGDLVVARTAPIMDELAQITGETVHLARLENSEVVYIAKRESTHPLRMFSAIGRRLPAHATALGKSLLAEFPDEVVRTTLPDHLVATTPHTVTDPELLIEAIRSVRRDGYAIDDEEATVGLRCFAVSLPFRGPSKDALSISVPVARLDASRQQQLIGLLLQARDQLRHQLGHSHALHLA